VLTISVLPLNLHKRADFQPKFALLAKNLLTNIKFSHRPQFRCHEAIESHVTVQYTAIVISMNTFPYVLIPQQFTVNATK